MSLAGAASLEASATTRTVQANMAPRAPIKRAEGSMLDWPLAHVRFGSVTCSDGAGGLTAVDAAKSDAAKSENVKQQENAYSI